VFARAGWEQAESTPQIAALPTAGGTSEVVAVKNAMPAALKKQVDESLALFMKNREGPTTCDGQKWEQVSLFILGSVFSRRYTRDSGCVE
jgi:hypothetical protein